jgi:hypothetical protein
MSELSLWMVWDHYLKSGKYNKEMERAEREFFDVKEGNVVFAIDETSQPFFLEWLTFDFIMNNGKTLLLDFYDSNPYDLPLSELKKYKDMAEENEYGPFEVLEVYKGKGLKIRHLNSGNVYHVREVNATYELKPNMVTFTRVGKVEEHYELVGANGFAWDIRMTEDFRKFLSEAQDKITPKKALSLYKGKGSESKDDSAHNTESLPENLEEARKELETAIQHSSLKGLVGAATIEQWIVDEVEKDKYRAASNVVNMVQGLFSDHTGREEVQLVIQAIMNLNNMLPRSDLNGKSPMEAKEENEKKGIGPLPMVDAPTPIKNRGNWKDLYDQMFEFMNNSDFLAAHQKCEEVFECLLNNKEIPREVYRLFANAALSCWGAGEEEQGVHILDQSLSLNPNYDFGVEMKDRYDRGEYDELIRFGRRQKLEAESKEALRHRWFLKDLKEWTTPAIFKKMEEFGIRSDEQEFRRMAEKYLDSEELAEKHFFPMFQSENHLDEDFLFFAVDVLWERLTPHIFSPHLLFSTILEFEDILNDGRRATKKNIEKSLNNIEYLVSRINEEDKKKVEQYPYELELLRGELVDIMELEKEIRERGMEVASLIQKKISVDSLESVFIVKKIIEKDESWRRRADEFLNEHRYAIYFSLDIAHTLKNIGQSEEAEKYFLKALEAVENKEKDGVSRSGVRDTTLLESYNNVLEDIYDFYKDFYRDKNKLGKYISYWAEIQEREEELDHDTDQEKTEENLEKTRQQYLDNRLADSHIEEYYNWIASLGINFKTEYLTETPKSNLGENSSNKKAGRNDPCPCGAKKKDGTPKKYKHCCGR